jgi:hypothetical protein
LDHLHCWGDYLPVLAQSTSPCKGRRKAFSAESPEKHHRLLCSYGVAHCHALENEFAAFSRTGHRWIRGVDRFWKIARQETVTIHPEGDEKGRHCKRFKG